MAATCMYEYSFVLEPDDALKCLICLAVARDPWQHGKCGRLFCDKCINRYGKRKPCPNCRAEQPKYMEDTKSKREINNLGVKCDNFRSKCPWKGTVRTFENHMATCKFTPVPCTNECKKNGNVRMIMRKNLEKHLEQCPNRNYKCQSCGKEGTFAYMKRIHEAECEKKMISCTNSECNQTMERGELKKHIENECDYAVISCRYKSFGCDVKMKRKDMGVHEQDDKAHLHQALNTVVKLQSSLDILMKEKSADEIKILFRDYEKGKNDDKLFCSQPFYTSSDGYRMQVEIYPNGHDDGNGTHVSVYAKILKGDNDNVLNWPFVGKVTFKLLNQLADENHHFKIISFDRDHDIRVEYGWGDNQFIHHSQLPYDPLNNTEYLKNDTLRFKVLVEVEVDKPWLECTAK